MSYAVVEAVAARIESQMAAPVYRLGVPEQVADRYVIVGANMAEPTSEDLGDSQRRRDVTVWVTAVAEDSVSRERAARRLMAVAEPANGALVNWRPLLGTSWRPVFLDSDPVRRDEDFPDRYVMYAVTRWGISHMA